MKDSMSVGLKFVRRTVEVPINVNIFLLFVSYLELYKEIISGQYLFHCEISEQQPTLLCRLVYFLKPGDFFNETVSHIFII
jgi:hypothetical protein